MDVLDPRIAAIAAGAAVIGSERVRRVLGRGFGYAAAGAVRAGSPVVNAGRDIVEEARDVAAHDGSTKARRSRAKSAASA
jgi:hypothetical protein